MDRVVGDKSIFQSLGRQTRRNFLVWFAYYTVLVRQDVPHEACLLRVGFGSIVTSEVRLPRVPPQYPT